MRHQFDGHTEPVGDVEAAPVAEDQQLLAASLAQAAVYVSSSPKSNRSGQAYWKAMEDVRKHGSQPVPGHLQNAPDRRMRSHGIGVGYKNPHGYVGGDVEQQGLPDLLQDRRYYEPSDQGWEVRIKERLDALMEARRRR